MQEKRKFPRISVSIPALFCLPPHPHLQVKIIELSKTGAAFLCPMSPGINAEAEIIFSLPFDENSHPGLRLDEDSYEFRTMLNIRHLYDVLATPGTPPDYRYVVGAQFMSLNENEQAILDQFLMKLR